MSYRIREINKGIKAGLPIGIGYLSVSFTFGIIAIGYGLKWWQAVLISMLTVTSAGQFAGIQIMANPGQYFEMIISQLTINVRYSFMSISLSQKVNKKFDTLSRAILGFMMTDEIFAVASSKKEVSRSFFAGLCILPYIGWSFGTLTGALLGNVMPKRLMSALSVAIYGMFIAIVVPDMKRRKEIKVCVIIAIIISCVFYYLPVLNKVSKGIAISLCAIITSSVCALMFPVKEEEKNE